jgi:tryptophan-rich sensory protein
MMQKPPALLLATAFIATAAVVGRRASPSPDHPRTAAWYLALRKPAYTPPGPVFGGAWAMLYPLLGWAGYRLLTEPPGGTRSIALGAWAANVLAIGAHPYLLFRRKQLGPSTALLTAEVAACAGLVAAAAKVERSIALSQVPLLLWTAFADLLNEELWRKN